MPFTVRLPSAWQARAHGSCSRCVNSWCPCNVDGMVTESWADRKYGGREITRMLADQWCYRFRARAAANRREQESGQAAVRRYTEAQG